MSVRVRCSEACSLALSGRKVRAKAKGARARRWVTVRAKVGRARTVTLTAVDRVGNRSKPRRIRIRG